MTVPSRRVKRPLAALLVERGFFQIEEDARRWIMAGQVLVDGQRIDKPGTAVATDVDVRVRGQRRYVSRGGYKLEAALDHFGVSPEGRVALDCGASTGGFTDCLLQRGASFVFAVEAGHGQLTGRLASDLRVRNLEHTNLGDLAPTALDPCPTLITLDLSYLSLTVALPLSGTLLAPYGDVLALFKPLFEVDDPVARRTGRLDNPALLIDALRRVLDAGATAGLTPMGAVKLALRPRHGVHEFFLQFRRGADLNGWTYDVSALAAVVEGPGVGRTDGEE